MKCRKLVLLDACYAGSVVDPIRAITRNGFPLTIFAACRKNETASEEGKNGLFTLSLINAVEGEVKPGRTISYEWTFGGYPGNSLVTFELDAAGKKTKVKLTHSGIETFLPDRNPALARENFLEGWTSLIGSSLKGFVEK